MTFVISIMQTFNELCYPERTMAPGVFFDSLGS